jgi:hypothetical protein
MRDAQAIETEGTEIPRMLIRNACLTTRIPYAEYPLMFHGHNERVDTESLRLSAIMWEALCRGFHG